LLERSFDVLSDHFNEQRIADGRIVRLIQKWLKAEVSEDGRRICSEVGTVQSDGIRPLLLINLSITFASATASGL
jgi:hypothetical protein